MAGAAALSAGCYSPSLDFDNGELACSPSGQCPSGYHCATDDRCWKDGSDPPPADANLPDANLPDAVLSRALTVTI